MPIPAMSAYCASKSGAEAFAHRLRGVLRHHGVAVGVAYLSWSDTDMLRSADARPALGSMRARLPWVFGRTYPLEPAVARIVDGVAGRRAHVYAQPWLRAMTWVRGATPSVTAAAPAGHARRLEDALREAGSGAKTPVAAGGLANSRARGRNGA